jgi:hypothetical protein
MLDIECLTRESVTEPLQILNELKILSQFILFLFNELIHFKVQNINSIELSKK